MSKKHFRLLASALFESRPGPGYERNLLTWNCMVNRIADVCAQVNPNFNREKFLTACRDGL